MAVYKERSFLTPWLRWGTVALVFAFLVFGVVMNVTSGEEETESTYAVIAAMVAGGIGVAAAASLRLDLKISRDTIESRMFPVEWKTRVFRISNVEYMELKPLKMFPRYGGFGRRWKPWKKEVAYILNRKHRLLVKLKDGRTRVYSTDQEQKLRRYLASEHPQLFKNNAHEKV